MLKKVVLDTYRLGNYTFPDELEIAIPGGISPSDIRGGYAG